MTWKIRTLSLAVATALATGLTGCGTVGTQTRNDIDQLAPIKRQVIETPMRLAPISRVSDEDDVLIPVTRVTVQRTGEWLKTLRNVDLEIKNPTGLTEVVKQLAQRGINIVSDLPLDSFTYTGKVNATDAETALRAILGSVGLDYQTDDVRRLVVIKPMSSRTWFLNIGNRKSSYSSAGGASNSSTGSTGLNANAGQTGSSATGMTGTSSGLGTSMSGLGTSSGSSLSSGTSNAGTQATITSNASTTSAGTVVNASDDFWTSLSNELNVRMSVMVPRASLYRSLAQGGNALGGVPGGAMPPVPMVGAAPQMIPAAGNMGIGGVGNNPNDLYIPRRVGSYSINPETGAITVQAPHWVLSDLDTYLKRVQDMYNTDITFQGEVVLVTSNKANSEGLDISSFAKWASGRWGAVLANNALGGVTVSFANGLIPAVVAGNQPVNGPLIGVRSAADGLQVFNAFLAEVGKVSVVQRPLVTTTSGVPGVFAKKSTDYFNIVTQQAAAGVTGTATTATQNILVQVDSGIELSVNPRIDISTGLIRTQINVNQVINSGTKSIPQVVTVGNNIQTINSDVPLLTKQNVNGEVLLRDGDLIVLGGQIEDNMTANESGLPGHDGPLGGILGVKKAVRGGQTYYFALRVAVTKRQ